MGVIGTSVGRVRALWDVAALLGLRAAWDVVRDMLLGRGVMTIHVAGIQTPVYCRRHESDVPMLLQILGRHEVDVAMDTAPEVIVDLGANIGLSSLAFARKYPGSTVIAVEPAAGNCAMFRRNCQAYANIRLVEAAVWHRRGRVAIENASDASCSFRVVEAGPETTGAVEAVTIEDLVALGGRGRIDLLKMDIEGAERELFEHGAPGWLGAVRTLMVELHDRFKPGCREAVMSATAGRRRAVEESGEYVIMRMDTAPAVPPAGTNDSGHPASTREEARQ